MVFDPNPLGVTAASVTTGEASDRVTVRYREQDVVLVAGHDEPVDGTVPPEHPGKPGPEPVAAHAVWTGRDEYVLTLRALEDVSVLTVTVRVTGDLVEATPALNVSFGPTEPPSLRGVLTDPA